MKLFKNIKQDTPEWHHLRKTHLTGTILKGIMGTPKARQKSIYKMIANRLKVDSDPEAPEYENPMERGKRLEDKARAMFELETGKSVVTVGFVEHDTKVDLGYSPDGLIVGSEETEDIEIKCPLEDNYVEMWLTNKPSDDYEWQIVHAFTVNPKLQKRYFVIYNPQIPVHPLHIIEVNREDIQEEIALAESKQQAFTAEVDAILSTIIKI